MNIKMKNAALVVALSTILHGCGGSSNDGSPLPGGGEQGLAEPVAGQYQHLVLEYFALLPVGYESSLGDKATAAPKGDLAHTIFIKDISRGLTLDLINDTLKIRMVHGIKINGEVIPIGLLNRSDALSYIVKENNQIEVLFADWHLGKEVEFLSDIAPIIADHMNKLTGDLDGKKTILNFTGLDNYEASNALRFNHEWDHRFSGSHFNYNLDGFETGEITFTTYSQNSLDDHLRAEYSDLSEQMCEAIGEVFLYKDMGFCEDGAVMVRPGEVEDLSNDLLASLNKLSTFLRTNPYYIWDMDDAYLENGFPTELFSGFAGDLGHVWNSYGVTIQTHTIEEADDAYGIEVDGVPSLPCMIISEGLFNSDAYERVVVNGQDLISDDDLVECLIDDFNHIEFFGKTILN